MPRTARQISSSGIYHIIMRGINRQVVFLDDEDHQRFLHTLEKYKSKSGFQIFAYCLMDNHIHLLIKEELEPLGFIMRRLCSSFVYWYNKKYERIGNLFQDRFKSEAVEDDAYFLTVLRYIHQNPLRGGLAKKFHLYPWSSYHDYLNPTGLTDTDFALNIFHENRERALKLFIDHQHIQRNERCLDLEDTCRLTDKDAIEVIKKVCQIDEPKILKQMGKKKRDAFLATLKFEHKLSTRQLSRLTGISKSTICSVQNVSTSSVPRGARS